MSDDSSPIAAVLASMAARQQLAYVDLLKHTAEPCPACNASPLCDEGRRLWNIWKGRDQ
ncbi:hypothetical protein ACFCWG_25025 [Streptomyces sp. NPDC056390]|uniref:hypothetical protein n=1 Tax=Streptomyces sp. NPDC056390 TaxID=3345806 RepID=UPI0035D7C96C